VPFCGGAGIYTLLITIFLTYGLSLYSISCSLKPPHEDFCMVPTIEALPKGGLSFAAFAFLEQKV